MKRVSDIVGSLLLGILLLPFLLIIALLIRVKLGSPVLFKQQRPGLHQKPFMLYKFRTMTAQTDASGRLLADHERMTPLGRWLRKYSLDEWPQLINVWKGEMSFVGPRPLLMAYLPLYTEEQAVRHHVRPGMTGWAQVHGRNAITWEEKFKLDTWYVRHRSLWLDGKIMLLTVKRIIQADGIQHQDHSSMPIFKGSTR